MVQRFQKKYLKKLKFKKNFELKRFKSNNYKFKWQRNFFFKFSFSVKKVNMSCMKFLAWIEETWHVVDSWKKIITIFRAIQNSFLFKPWWLTDHAVNRTDNSYLQYFICSTSVWIIIAGNNTMFLSPYI